VGSVAFGQPRAIEYRVKKRSTSVPETEPVFFTLKDTVHAGRWSQSAAEEPTACGVGLPAAQFASSAPS
jgi:hypothetical protein